MAICDKINEEESNTKFYLRESLPFRNGSVLMSLGKTLTEQKSLGKKTRTKTAFYDDDDFVYFEVISGSEAKIIRKFFVKISGTEFKL